MRMAHFDSSQHPRGHADNSGGFTPKTQSIPEVELLAGDAGERADSKWLVCSKCGDRKPAEEFHKAGNKTSGRHGTCKVCIAQRSKKYETENRERIAAKAKAYKEANRESIRATQLIYRNQNAAKIATKAKATYQRDKGSRAAKAKARYQADKERVKAQRAAESLTLAEDHDTLTNNSGLSEPDDESKDVS